MIKRFSLGMVSLMTVVLLAACGNGDPAVDDPATEPLDDPVEDPADPALDPAEDEDNQDEEDMEGPGEDTP